MPLSPPAPRKPLHTRVVECRGYEREDGLWDIEAHLVDTKAYTFVAHSGESRAPGVPVHNMWLRFTIDLDMLIHDVEAVTDSGPYAACGNITPNFKALKGITLGPGWRRKALALVGGVKGCTHLVELLGPLATTAFQTTVSARNRRDREKPTLRKPYQIDGCHMYADNSPTARQRWPQYYANK